MPLHSKPSVRVVGRTIGTGTTNAPLLVHIHRDLGTLFPQLSHGFVLQSQLRCATYPRSWHKQGPGTRSSENCPHCVQSSPAREKETYDHLVFSCKAWDTHRTSAAQYTMSLLAGLRHDIRGAHNVNRTAWHECVGST